MFVDTHCHIHDSEFFPTDREEVYAQAMKGGVQRLICVGTSNKSSKEAVEFASTHEQAYAAVGVHPHDATEGVDGVHQLLKGDRGNVVAVGEIGLDYFYTNSPREVQIAMLERQLQFALDAQLPVIFHVREAFADFWPIFDNFQGLSGVLHSFTDTQEQLDNGFERGLYVGVNGISTFTKNTAQQAMYRAIPLERMVLETDAPFLAPVPHRGRTNLPAYIPDIARFHADARQVSVEEIMQHTTDNAKKLFLLP